MFEGFNAPCANGRPCELGKAAQCERQSGSIDNDVNIREHDARVCMLIGYVVPMFCFAIDIDNFQSIDVYELTKMQLLGMSGIGYMVPLSFPNLFVIKKEISYGW